jgi:hypothetical protein
VTVPVRWENGSEFSWLGLPTAPRTGTAPWDAGLLLSSGRDALRLVLSRGVAEHGWRRLWVPEYFCQHVVAALQRPDLALLPYVDHPLLAEPRPPEARTGDAVLVMNYFGLRTGFPAPDGPGVHVIEDHSHDPSSWWARTSRADYCIASLRKTLPVSDGGAVWSPRGHPLPSPPALDPQRRRAAALKLSGMILKAMYLGGMPVDKARYRDLARRGERALAHPAVSDISEVSRALVASFDLIGWREARRRNAVALRAALGDPGWADVLAPADGEPCGGPGARPGDDTRDAVAFSTVLVVDTPERRQLLLQRLHAASIFPAVLWPLETTVLPVGEEARDVSRRLLSIHCDGRYDSDDMARVAGVAAEAGRRIGVLSRATSG